MHEEPYKTEDLDGCTMITSSAWRNNSNAASGGVGMLIQKKIESSLIDIEPINSRILVAHFNGNPRTSVVVHYSPVEGSNQ